MKRKKLEKTGKHQCSCCKTYVSYRERSEIKKSYNQFIKIRGEHYIQYDKLLKYFTWACDSCIKSKKAIPAKSLEQNYMGSSLPYFAYFDKERNCRTCNSPFSFTKEEQKYWYEELKFNVHADAVHCENCRKNRRIKIANNNRIMELSAKEDKTLNELKELAKIYQDIGSEQKVNELLNRIKKLEK